MERHTEIEHGLRPGLFWDCMQYKVVWRVESQMANRKGRGSEVKGKDANGVGSQQPCTVHRKMVYPALL